MPVVIAIIALCIIILVHELGHFGAAKMFKMNVYQFNLGMGPLLWKKQYKETQYGLRLLPIGGSCMLGEDEEATDDPKEFRNKPVWQRIIVIAAGAILNLVLGLILCIALNANSNVNIHSLTVARFTTLEKDNFTAISNTGESGLQEKDEIYSINGMRIFHISEVYYKLDNSLTKSGVQGDYVVYEFVVIRDGEKVTLPQVRFAAEPNERGGMKYIFDFKVYGVEKTFKNVLEYSVRDAVGKGRIIWLSLMDIIGGTYGVNDLSGPVGIASQVSEITSEAKNYKEIMLTILEIAGFITINLGLVNLLPIPALDGARIIFLAVEGIRRKPLKAEVEGMIHFVGFALLMLLIIVVTFNDIRKLFV
ncbi:MAG: site-2 protease family protein [Oscillospiraceae bacterium]|nr:site-2 protease family protein [Oscillospiraceae bacterium]